MMEEKKKKILILSNNALSKSSSNGRTLENLLLGWPKNKLAQLYIISDEPDFDVCNNYYFVSDLDAVKALFGKLNDGRVQYKNESREIQLNKRPNVNNKIKKNAFTMLARELVWGTKKWMNFGFNEWVSSYQPEVILLQAGDSAFMCNLAQNLSRKFEAPLIIYNSEGYYFKNYDYFRAKGFSHFLYPVYKKLFCHSFEKTIKLASMSIYICEALKKEYDTTFNLPSETIYTATTLKPFDMVRKKIKCDDFTVSYLGNLGVGRLDSLCEIGEILNCIDPNAHLDIYGKCPNEKNRKKMEESKGIRYKGFISYEQVIKVMHESDLLVHVESFEEFYREDSKFAFSTKIADSLASGTCFLLYAPKEMACYQYLQNNNAAYVASNKNELEKCIRAIIHEKDGRKKFLDNAQRLVLKNHDAKKNAEHFQELLMRSVKYD